MLQGENDEDIPHESVKKLVEKLSAQRAIEIDYTVVPGANHFFAGKIDEMMTVIDNYLDAQLPDDFKRSEK
jgi:alpha/beta superfamily hydrolase